VDETVGCNVFVGQEGVASEIGLEFPESFDWHLYEVDQFEGAAALLRRFQPIDGGLFIFGAAAAVQLIVSDRTWNGG
jgi:hypothetical protein